MWKGKVFLVKKINIFVENEEIIKFSYCIDIKKHLKEWIREVEKYIFIQLKNKLYLLSTDFQDNLVGFY